MKIDFSQAIKNWDGSVAEDNGTPINLFAVCCNALLATLPNEQPDGMTKIQRFAIALKIKNGGEVEVTAEEISIIKDLVGKTYSTLIVGQVYNMLEQKEIM
jgi:hypothetical protein